MDSLELVQKLQKTIEAVPNFPKEGILFRDISPIFLYPDIYEKVIDQFVEFSRGKIDVVCGIESRGFLFGIAIAVRLNVPFVLIRKKGKLPPPFVSQKYDLEYGSSQIEMKEGQIKKGDRVLVHDDLLATGGTTEAATNLVEKQGASVKQFSFLIELENLKGKEKLKPFTAEIYSILKY